ncbi:hypothetical protein MRX96_045098 [Rhipicephalus microplus]
MMHLTTTSRPSTGTASRPSTRASNHHPAAPPSAVLSSLASADMAEPPPTLPSSVLVCRAEESFEDFCRRNDLSFLF